MAMSALEMQAALRIFCDEVVACDDGQFFAAALDPDEFPDPREPELPVQFFCERIAEGMVVRLVLPEVYQISDTAHPESVLAVLFAVSQRIYFVKVEVDDDAVRYVVEIPVMDAKLSAGQLEQAVRSLAQSLIAFHPVVVEAMSTGNVDFDLATPMENWDPFDLDAELEFDDGHDDEGDDRDEDDQENEFTAPRDVFEELESIINPGAIDADDDDDDDDAGAENEEFDDDEVDPTTSRELLKRLLSDEE